MIKMMVEEIWKPIKGYEGLYEISNWGRVKSLGNGDSNVSKMRILKVRKTRCGYIIVNLYKNTIMKTFYIHRLVADAFLPNPENLPCINHKDEDKTNNSVENLEYCTYKYNINYGTANKRRSKTNTNGKCSKPILQFSLTGEFIREYPSIRECGRNGFNVTDIILCCKGRYKSHKGYIWRYKEDYS